MKLGAFNMAYADEFLGYLELRQDLLFDRIPATAVSKYIQQSLEIGRKAAQSYQRQPMMQLFDAHDIKLVAAAKSGQLFRTKLRAQFEQDKQGHNQVTYYEESITNLAESSGLSYQQALNIHLAHEFFHYWEMQQAEPVNEQLPTVKLAKLFGWQRYGTILRTSEIAANAFAKQFLKSPVLPNFYDYRYLISNGELPTNWLVQAEKAFDKLPVATEN